MSDAYEEAEKASAADKGGGKFIALKNDKDKTVGMFVGEPAILNQVFNKATGKYEPFTKAHADAGLESKPSFVYNFFEIGYKLQVGGEKAAAREDAHLTGAMKEITVNNPTFKTVLAVRTKYANPQGSKNGLDVQFYEIERQGAKGDTSTKYMILPERPASAGEIAAIKAMKIQSVTQLLGASPAQSSGHDDGSSDVNSKSNGVASADAVGTIVSRIKTRPMEDINAFKAAFRVDKFKDLLAKDVTAAMKWIDDREKPPQAAPTPTGEVNPFE